MAAAERLQVGAVRERDLDLDEHVARVPARGSARPRAAGRRGRGSAAPSRREHDLERAAGAVEREPVLEAVERQHRRLGQVERRAAARAPPACARGVAEREPVSVSSFR